MPPAAAPRAADEGTAERPVQRVLIVGPDDGDRRTLHVALDRRGIAVAAVGGIDLAARWLGDHRCDVVIADADAVGELTRLGAPVVALVADAAASLRALEAGAIDCLRDAADDAALAMAFHRARRHVHAPPPRERERALDGRDLCPPGSAAAGRRGWIERLEGTSTPMQVLRATITRVAQHRSTVLVTGESGTGKELVARAIHDESTRRGRRFVAVNCAAIPHNLLESELFGHKKGAFTDAVRDRVGLFEEADGGTLFLDEVGELPLGLQVKLLRAIQESEIRRVGDTASIKVDVRLVAATLRDLTAEIAAGRFREDLYYRLNVLPVEVPPLRERPGDVALLAVLFAKGRARFTADALELLARQTWPGNVRELENTVERALVLCEAGEIDAALLAGHLRAPAPSAPPVPIDPAELSIKKATRALELDLIRRALEATGGNRTAAARLLEISHRALLYKIKEYGL